MKSTLVAGRGTGIVFGARRQSTFWPHCAPFRNNISKICLKTVPLDRLNPDRPRVCPLEMAAGVNRPISVHRFPRRALTLCLQLCMGIQPDARFPAWSAEALPATLYGHFTQAIYRNQPIDACHVSALGLEERWSKALLLFARQVQRPCVVHRFVVVLAPCQRHAASDVTPFCHIHASQLIMSLPSATSAAVSQSQSTFSPPFACAPGTARVRRQPISRD